MLSLTAWVDAAGLVLDNDKRTCGDDSKVLTPTTALSDDGNLTNNKNSCSGSEWGESTIAQVS